MIETYVVVLLAVKFVRASVFNFKILLEDAALDITLTVADPPVSDNVFKVATAVFPLIVDTFTILGFAIYYPPKIIAMAMAFPVVVSVPVLMLEFEPIKILVALNA